ncbi:DUF746 domain-containing protein [Cupriavidus sp. D39]|nr:DUF746 domain-containing protein [Cupriavidus sp. D39]MCY0854902.1 DUF746 domain-containing protein [Cupriavidus sp. D39]
MSQPVTNGATRSNWLARFRELLLLHDPSGKWKARVRLGIKFQFSGRCPRCPNMGARAAQSVYP